MTRDQLLFIGAAALVAVTILGLNLFTGSNEKVGEHNAISVLAENVTEPMVVGSSVVAVDQNQQAVIRLNLAMNPPATSTLSTDVATIVPATTFERLLRYESSASGWQSVELATGQSTPLARGITSPLWSPKGERIAYLFMPDDRGRATLTIADRNGSNWANVVELGHFYDRLWWSPLETYMV